MSTITYKILLADDNPVNLDLATRLLEKKGHEITTAENGQEAVDRFLESSFDVILMDLEMPKLDGKAAAIEIPAANGYTPISALTGHDKDDKVKQLRQAGFNGFLKKPVSESELKSLVDKHLV